MRTVGVRKYSKEGGENSGNPLRRFRSHEMKQHAITAKGSDLDAQLGGKSVYATQLRKHNGKAA
jgi:hypothetical protein